MTGTGIVFIIFIVLTAVFGLSPLLIYLFIIRRPNREFSAYRKNYWENLAFALLLLFFFLLIIVGIFLLVSNDVSIKGVGVRVIAIIIIVIGAGGLIATPLIKSYLNAKRRDKIKQKEVDKIKRDRKQ